MSVLTDLRNRGVKDAFFVVCDGLKGLPAAIETVWPQAITQTCVIHLLRASFGYASRRDWSAIAHDLKPVYTAVSELAVAADQRSDPPEQRVARRYPPVVRVTGSVASLIALVILSRNSAKMMTTKPAVMIVTITQPGTSPRSDHPRARGRT
jgi:hypothetical protein